MTTYMPLEGGAGLPKREEVVALLSPASMVNLCTVKKSSDKRGDDDHESWAGIIFESYFKITTILRRTTVRKSTSSISGCTEEKYNHRHRFSPPLQHPLSPPWRYHGKRKLEVKKKTCASLM